MIGAYRLFFAIIFFSNLLNPAHLIPPKPRLQRYCAKGDWKSAEKLFTNKLKKNPHYKWGTSLTMLCMIRAFQDNREFLRTLIEYNEDKMIDLSETALYECLCKKHYKSFLIVLEKSDDKLLTNLSANLLFKLFKDQAPDNVFFAIFERYQKYYTTHQRLPVSLEERSKDGFETILGYAFSHGHINHARMLLQNGADFVEGILKKDVFGYFLREKTAWDSAIVALWCEQDEPLKRLEHHVFKQDKVVGSLLIRFFLRAIDSPLLDGFEDIALLFRYHQLLSCLRSIGHNGDQPELNREEWLYDGDNNKEIGLKNGYFFETIKKHIDTTALFLNRLPRFIQCQVQDCPGGSFSIQIYARGTKHFECEICFQLQCISCGKRHPQAPCKVEKNQLRPTVQIGSISP